ncbi:MAG: hypothetical protein QOI86_543 [Actinomycetota bacterium]|nr:hypothetical protein [Actinomycetota bacterium]
MPWMLRLGLSLTAGLLLWTPAVAAEDSAGPPSDVGADTGVAPAGFYGFSTLETMAQSQLATGYFFAIGDEVNRLVGARSEIVGPPVSSRVVAAFVQRGTGAVYVYGVAGGPGGTSGALPDPPPGEAPAYYPPEPHESTFAGPVTTALQGPQARTVDGRFHARADEKAPTGLADAAVTRVELPGYLAVEQGTAISRSEPVAGGMEAESVSVLHGVTVGPLQIETMVSRAYGFVPSVEGEPKAVATTVVDGATVGKIPVKITDAGIVVADQKNPGLQAQVQAALTQAGLSDIRLLGSLAAPGGDHQRVTAQAGTLQVIHRDPKMGASNPQGFQGGGFSVGGAEVSVVGRRCQPACASAPGDSSSPGLGLDPSPTDPTSTATESPSPGASPVGDQVTAPPSQSRAEGGEERESLAAALDPALASAATNSEAATVTTDVTPKATTSRHGRAGVASRRVPAGATLAANALNAGEANDVRRLFLALTGAVGVIVILRTVLWGARRKEGQR